MGRFARPCLGLYNPCIKTLLSRVTHAFAQRRTFPSLQLSLESTRWGAEEPVWASWRRCLLHLSMTTLESLGQLRPSPQAEAASDCIYPEAISLGLESWPFPSRGRQPGVETGTAGEESSLRKLVVRPAPPLPPPPASCFVRKSI